jgi:hypothetical protein
MVIGGWAVGIALAEIGAAQVAAPPTFGLSEVAAVIHAPFVFAVGGLIFAAGAGAVYYGATVMWDSNVLQHNYGPIIRGLGPPE